MTHGKTLLWKNFTAALAALFLWSAVPLPAAQAGIVGTGAAVESVQHTQVKDRLKTFIAREDVQKRLEAYGVSAAEARARVNSLTPAEARRLAGRLENMPAGGTDLVGALLFLFVLLLVTDLLGLTDVFPFTR